MTGHMHENYNFKLLEGHSSIFLLPFTSFTSAIKIEGGEIKSICPVEEYGSQDVCPGREEGGEEDQRMRRVTFKELLVSLAQ